MMHVGNDIKEEILRQLPTHDKLEDKPVMGMYDAKEFDVKSAKKIVNYLNVNPGCMKISSPLTRLSGDIALTVCMLVKAKK